MLVQHKFEIKTLSTSMSGTRQQHQMLSHETPCLISSPISNHIKRNIWIICLVWWVTNVAIDLKLIGLNKLKSANKINIASFHINIFIQCVLVMMKIKLIIIYILCNVSWVSVSFVPQYADKILLQHSLPFHTESECYNINKQYTW